ncbi:hypothetical protein EJB05_39335, partial [Eragrostis curvula]
MFPPELSEARIAWTLTCVLVTVLDDVFDVAGSREENENLAMLIDRWDTHGEIGFCSEHVEIAFRAVYETSKQLGAKAAAVQNRSVVHHIAEMWADVARAMLTEAEWRMNGYVPLPSMEEYMRVAEVSWGLGPILPATLYFVGPELPEEVVRCPERKLLRLVLAEGSAVPRPCKQVFWDMWKVMELFYRETDGYQPKEMRGAEDAVLHEPLLVGA